jgi:hypothetical protein
MTSDSTIHVLCPICNGTKIRNVLETPTPCLSCEETGYFEWGKKVVDSDVFNSYEVLECLDATEHNALTDAQKDGVSQILSCGLVDLNEGKVGRVRLWNWFGAESTTVASLTALLA